MTRAELLDQAKSIVTGERQQAYGSVEDNFARIAAYWSAHLGITVSTHDVGILMILLKLARLHNTPGHEDSLVDVAGYAACAVGLQKPPEPPVEIPPCDGCRYLRYTGFIPGPEDYFARCEYDNTPLNAIMRGCGHWEAKE